MKLKRRSLYNEAVRVNGKCGFLRAGAFPLHYTSLLNNKQNI